MKKRLVITFMLFSSSLCIADEVPQNSLQVEYEKQISNKQGNILSLQSVYQIPVKTYQYLDNVFNTFYKKLDFNTSLSDKTFDDCPHNEVVAIPLIAENEQGLKLEIFGNFTDPSTKKLSNFSTDQALSDYYSNTQQFDLYESELAIGAGFSFKASDNGRIKVIISNTEIPGYGSSNALLGYEASF